MLAEKSLLKPAIQPDTSEEEAPSNLADIGFAKPLLEKDLKQQSPGNQWSGLSPQATIGKLL